VHAVVVLLTLLATVSHLAVGCCLHASHPDRGAPCCLASRVAHHDACDSDHDHDLAPMTGDRHPVGEAAGGCPVAPISPDCDCDGCSCVATTAQPGASYDAPAPMASIGHGRIAAAAILTAPRRLAPVHEPPLLSALRPPLSERLLV
jgi:hypothetical protein